MIRTVFSIDEDDKQWLDRKAAREGVSMTEVIRRAVRRLRSEEAQAQDFDRLLHATSGISHQDLYARLSESGLNAHRRKSDWKSLKLGKIGRTSVPAIESIISDRDKR